MRAIVISAFAAAGLALGGCASERMASAPKESAGTAIGAIAGAAIGSQFGGGTGERLPAGVARAAIGGMLGHRNGAALADEDKGLPSEAPI